MIQKLDILVIVAHPDDAELGCGGTIVSQVKNGKKVGVVDLTQGEMGTRGSVAERFQESADAASILGLAARENLRFRDAFFQNDEAHQLEVVRMIRRYQPEIVITNAIEDRHPDHAKGAALVKVACFLAGLARITTTDNGQEQTAWRPKNLYHIVQSNYIDPDFVVDISDTFDQKMKAVLAYKTQFHSPTEQSGSQTFISSPEFLDFLAGRAREYGQAIRVMYGEGFTTDKKIGIKDVFNLI